MILQFDRILNVRDLGGVPAADGRKIKPGLLIRGAKLDLAGDADVARLSEELRLCHVIDFRDPNEVQHRPDRPVPGAAYHHLPALPAPPVKTPPELGQIENPDFEGTFLRIYGELAESERTAEAYREFFRILLRCEGPVYFHCAQGKDRTGVAALLLLAALGADGEAAEADYYLTNDCLRPELERQIARPDRKWPPEELERLFQVWSGPLTVWKERIEKDCGGPVGYLTERLGLTEADFRTLQDYYLE